MRFTKINAQEDYLAVEIKTVTKTFTKAEIDNTFPNKQKFRHARDLPFRIHTS